MAQKKITDYQLRANVTDDVNFITDDGVQTYRNTAAQIKAYVLSLASVATSALQDLSVTAAKLAAGAVTDDKTSFTTPTTQTFLSGSGTYTRPAGVKYIRVKMVGGGGAGGTGNSTSAAAGKGGDGGNSVFGPFTAGGGIGGQGATTASIGTPGSGGVLAGSPGGLSTVGTQGGLGAAVDAASSKSDTPGGFGGNSRLGGAGGGSYYGAAGYAAKPNSGSGGGGGSGISGGGQYPSPGGGSGAFVDTIISSPAATYSYAVGAGGTVTAGSGYVGGAGGSGMILIEEYYQ